MKRISAIAQAAMLGLMASAGAAIPAAGLGRMLEPAKRTTRKAKTGNTPADKEALAKAEAKRLRRGRRKD